MRLSIYVNICDQLQLPIKMGWSGSWPKPFGSWQVKKFIFKNFIFKGIKRHIRLCYEKFSTKSDVHRVYLIVCINTSLSCDDKVNFLHNISYCIIFYYVNKK